MLEQEFLREQHGKAQIRLSEDFWILVPIGQHHAGINAQQRHSGFCDFPQVVRVFFSGFVERVQEALDVQGLAVGPERGEVHSEAKLVQQIVQVQHHRGFVEGGEGVQRQCHTYGFLLRAEAVETVGISGGNAALV